MWPPPDKNKVIPWADAPKMPPAARVWSNQSRLSTDAVGIGVAAGNAVTKPGRVDSVTVMFKAKAIASAGTPAGKGMVTDPPGATMLLERESNSRDEVFGTNRPAATVAP